MPEMPEKPDPGPSTTAPPAPKTNIEAIDELFKPVNRSDAPGLVVGIAQCGKILYRRGFGLASVELGVANTPRTRMRIGSTSKHFTCVAALLLAEEGKLDIDAGVRRYLPELRDLQPEPTLRQLMTHTSGYRCTWTSDSSPTGWRSGPGAAHWPRKCGRPASTSRPASE